MNSSSHNTNWSCKDHTQERASLIIFIASIAITSNESRTNKLLISLSPAGLLNKRESTQHEYGVL